MYTYVATAVATTKAVTPSASMVAEAPDTPTLPAADMVSQDISGNMRMVVEADVLKAE